MSEQTAIDWLVNQLNNMSWGHIAIDVPKEMIEQAKQMEKKHIIDAANQFEFQHIHGYGICVTKGEQYYLETFRSEHICTYEKCPQCLKNTSSQTISDKEIVSLANEHILYNDEINRDLCMLKLTPIDMEEKLLEYWNGGIKSTEEGGKSFDQYHNEHHEDIDKRITRYPEMSNDEIFKASEIEFSKPDIVDMGIDITPAYKQGFVVGAEWYRQQLKLK